jgi:hypothetical protein
VRHGIANKNEETDNAVMIQLCHDLKISDSAPARAKYFSAVVRSSTPHDEAYSCKVAAVRIQTRIRSKSLYRWYIK